MKSQCIPNKYHRLHSHTIDFVDSPRSHPSQGTSAQVPKCQGRSGARRALTERCWIPRLRWMDSIAMELKTANHLRITVEDTHIYTHTCMHACMHTYIHPYVYVYVYIYIYIHLQITITYLYINILFIYLIYIHK